MDFSDQGDYIAIGNGTSISCFDNSSDTPIWINQTCDFINAVAISGDGRYIIGGGKEQYVYLFNRVTGANPIWSFKTTMDLHSLIPIIIQLKIMF